MEAENRHNKPTYSQPTYSQPNCRCQRCATCVENAQRDRIFCETLAYPDYYRGQQPRNSSPMAARLALPEPGTRSRTAQMSGFLERARTVLVTRP